MVQYSPDRQKLHKQIVAGVFAHTSAKIPNPHHESPHLIVIGGAPGGGKTTITRWIEAQEIVEGPYVRIDVDVFRALPEFDTIFSNGGKPHPEKSPELIGEYYHIRQLILEEAIRRKVSVMLEDHLDANLHAGYEDRDAVFVKTAKQAGFTTALLAMTVTPYDYFQDWKVRNYQSEHVPYVFGIHKNLSSRWPEITEMFDNSFLYQRNSAHGAYFDGHYHLSMIGAFEANPKKETIYAPRKFERFKLWQEVNVNGVTLQTAFSHREAGEYSDFERAMGGPGEGIPGETRPPSFVDRIRRQSQRRLIE